MLEAANVGIRFGSKRGPLTVKGVNISVQPGKTVGLVGESGSGKSSVAKAFVGINPLAEGEIRLDGETIAKKGQRLVNPSKFGVQLVFQDPRTSLNPKMTVGESLEEAAALMEKDRASVKARAFELLAMVDLNAPLMKRYPHELSGGQLQRVSIARALALRPNYLLLDEVTASLDVSVQATVLNLLRQLQQQLGFAMLYISHDLSVIKYVSDHVYVMRNGEVVEEATVHELFENPKTQYTKDLIAAVPRLGGGRWQNATA